MIANSAIIYSSNWACVNTSRLTKRTKQKSVDMGVKDLKWYSPFVFLVGAILSFADPITDILTLVEFYRADHRTWFGVGLTFVLLPCLAFPVVFCRLRVPLIASPSSWAKTVLCALHPFSAAFGRVEAVFSVSRDGGLETKSTQMLNMYSITST